MQSLDDISDTILTRSLGTLIAPYADENGDTQRVSLDLLVELDPDGIERKDDGSIEFASVTFKARFPASSFPAYQHYVFYTDYLIEIGINNYLKHLGHSARVGFSEQGRQTAGELDFDVDYRIIQELWPDLSPVPAMVGP